MESRHSANTGSTGGSATTTITTTEPQPSDRKPKVLRLKLTASADPKVKWSEDTVDNENMGKKSSKRCCIYHKPRAFGESDSDESDSDTEKACKEPPKPGKPKNYQRFHA